MASLGEVLYRGGQAVMRGARTVGRTVFGDAEGPGLLGTGQFRPKEYAVDAGAAEIANAERMRQQYQEGASQAATRTGATAQAAQLDTGAQAEFRQGQSALAQALAAQAAGQGPSLAAFQLNRATDRNLAQALSMAQSVRGGMAGGAALRSVGQQRAAIGQEAAATSAELALTEQMQARGALGQVLAGARGQDIALASEQAGLAQQAALANLGAEMQQRSLNDSMVQFYQGQGLTLEQAQQQARMELERLRVQNALGTQGLALQGYQAAAGARQDLIRDLARAGASAAGTGAAAP